MKLKKLIEPEFLRAFGILSDLQVSPAVSYKVADLLEKITQERIKYENIRQKLIQKHGEKDENGKIKVNDTATEYLLKDVETFQKELNELQEIEVLLPKINLSELGDIKISGRVMAQVRDLLIT